MAIVSVASIRVRPDLTAFRKELKAGLEATDAEITIGVNVDTKKATGEMDAWRKKEESRPIHKDVEVDHSQIDSAFRAVTSLTSSLASSAVAASLLTAGLNAAATVGPVLAATAGTLLLIPGAVAAGGAALATWKLGADGIAKAFESLTPTINKLKSAISATFTKELKPAVDDLKSVIPGLTGGFKNIASSISGVIGAFAKMIKTGGGATAINFILNTTAGIVRSITPLLVAIGQAFLKVASIGVGVLGNLALGADGAARKLTAYVDAAAKSGKIESVIKGGLNAFKEIFSVLKDIGSIVAAVFQGLSDGGVGVAGAFGGAVSTVKDFVTSLPGKQLLKDIGSLLAALAKTVSDVLRTAFEKLGPAVREAIPVVKELVTQVGDVLKKGLEVVGPLIVKTFGWLKDNMDWVVPAAIGIGAIVTALKAWAAIQFIVNTLVRDNPVIFIASVIIGAIALIITNWDKLGEVVTSVWNGIQSVVGTVVDWITGAVRDVGSFIGNVFRTAGDIVKSVWRGVSNFFGTIWDGITSAVTGVGRWIGDRFSDAVNFITSIFRGLGNFISGIWSGIGNGLKSALNAVLNVINGAVRGVNRITGIIGIPSIPEIPLLAEGGTIRQAGLAVVGEAGPELINMKRGASVTPLPGSSGFNAGNFGGGDTNIEIHVNDQALSDFIQVRINDSNRQIRRSVKSGRRIT